MTGVEHYVENAISFLEEGGEYEEFFKSPMLKCGEQQTGISLSDMWDIVQYVHCSYRYCIEDECRQKLVKLYGYEVEE